MQNIVISQDIESSLNEAIGKCNPDKIFILSDSTTEKLCIPLVKGLKCLSNALHITIKPTDTFKNIDAVSHVWQQLSDNGATRHSCLINIGGGMVTDLGGFAASTFKRGIAFINIPTTLLAMVDASVGGKTGINFCGLKNEIGVFNNADTVIVCTKFLNTLDKANLLSGYAEMIKHGLISNEEMWNKLMCFDIVEPDFNVLQDLIADNINIKKQIVEIDPTEKGIRKALNLGHTVGHAFEAMSMMKNNQILHGYAVAYGIICELYLSYIKTGFHLEKLRKTVNYIKNVYGFYNFTCSDYEALYELMKHDKKNIADSINFTLLSGIGDIKINQTATKDEILESLDFLREGL